MDDSELSSLMEEVEFKTPSRTNDNVLKKESFEPNVKKDENARGAQSKRVLIGDSSLSKMDNMNPIFEEATYDAYSAILNDSNSDEDVKKKSGTSKDNEKYKLFLVDDVELVCGRVMSQGVTFCINKLCKTNHRTEDLMDLQAGQMYVMKSSEKGRSTAFVSPSLLSNNIDSNVVGQWLGMSQTLHAWT